MMKIISLFLLLFLAGCFTVTPAEQKSIWNDMVNCYSGQLGEDISPTVVEPTLVVVDFQVCPVISYGITGCAWTFQTELGYTWTVGRKNGEDVVFEVGKDVPLLEKNGRKFVSLVLIEEGKNRPSLVRHEYTHAILGQLFNNTQTKERGFGDIDPNHESFYFSHENVCKYK